MATCHRCGVSKRHQLAKCGNCGAGGGYNLSNLDVDEVSFVERGANQRAHVVLWKSDDTPMDFEAQYDAQARAVVAKADMGEVQKGLDDLAGSMVEQERAATREQAIAKTFGRDPSLYDAMYGPQLDPAPWHELVTHDPNPVRKQDLPGWVTRQDIQEAEQAEAARQERVAAQSRRVYGGSRVVDTYPQWGLGGKFE